jgi:hypothetical protein
LGCLCNILNLLLNIRVTLRNLQNHGMATKSFHRTDEAFITGSPYGELNNNVVFVQQKLPEPGICFTWQGTHYKTFDGRVYSFDSKCEHILVRDAIDKTFSIIVQNDPKCSNNPPNCHKIIRIYFDKKEYILKRSSEGIPIFGTPKKRLPIPGQFPGLRIEMSAHYIILSLDAVGSKLKWDGEVPTILLPDLRLTNQMFLSATGASRSARKSVESDRRTVR